MALNLSYIELKRVKFAVERYVNATEFRIRRQRNVVENPEYGLVPGKKRNQDSAVEVLSDLEEKRENYSILLTKIQEEIRKLEGLEARTSSIRNVK